MLPHSASTKRNNYHLNSRHTTSYHPYYSSSPLTNNTVSVTGQIISHSVKQNDHEEENYLEFDQVSNNSSNMTPNKFTLYYSQNSQNSSDVDNDLSSVRTPQTHPPTTPVSSTNCNNSLNQANDSQAASPSSYRIENKVVVIEEKSECYLSNSSSVTSISQLNKEAGPCVTPVTISSSSSTVPLAKVAETLDGDLLKTGSSSSSSVYSSALATYSRSSSMNSLNSFDVKSTYSSIPSEYSSVSSSNPFNNLKNSEDMYSTKYQGCITPTTYGELPSSPGELFPCNQQEQQDANFFYIINNSNQVMMNVNSSVNNSAVRNNTKQALSMNEISVLTVDSNPSKSNDITVVERTVMGSHSHNNTHLGGSGGFSSSMGNTFIYNPDDTTASTNHDHTNLEGNFEEEDKVISYDMEGSLYAASNARSNVSGLTFPSEPTADLAFIRDLLNKKSTPLISKTKSLDCESTVDIDKLENLFQMIEHTKNPESKQSMAKQYQWSNYTSQQSSFTPPMKLPCPSSDRTNKKLFDDEEDEKDELRSIASLPSDIACDRSKNLTLNKSGFSALFNKLEQGTSCESSPIVNATKKSFFYLNENERNNSPANFKDPSYFSQFSIQKEQKPTVDQIPSNYERFYEDKESYNNSYNQSFNQSLKETSDNDEQFLNDFISEMLPKSNHDDKSDSESETSNESFEFEVNNAPEQVDQNEKNNTNDEDDFEQQQQLNKYLAERSVYRSESENVMSRILPKIEEVDNENDESRVEEELAKPVKSKQCLTNTMKPASISVHMTRTALLRENKIKKQNTTASSKPTSKKRSSNVKNNENPEKQQRMPLSNYNMPTKSSTLKTSSQGSSKKTALAPSNRLNLLKSSKSFNTST